MKKHGGSNWVGAAGSMMITRRCWWCCRRITCGTRLTARQEGFLFALTVDSCSLCSRVRPALAPLSFLSLLRTCLGTPYWASQFYDPFGRQIELRQPNNAVQKTDHVGL